MSVDISYSDLEKIGWPLTLINDYQDLKTNLKPQSGTDTDPNGIYVSNLNGFYIDTATPGQWFNPTEGIDTGWIQLV
jgi:hypothetical protein